MDLLIILIFKHVTYIIQAIEIFFDFISLKRRKLYV